MSRLYQDATDRKIIGQYADYAQQMTALLEDYHRARLAAAFPAAAIVEPAGVVVYDLTMSAKSADTLFGRLDCPPDKVKDIIWDLANRKAYLLLTK